MPEIQQFLERLKAGLHPQQASLVRFITKETYINLRPYSFLGHEFQQYFTELIEVDPNIDISAEKCSQIGLSEICFRIVLGKMALHPGYSVIYAMPSKTFAMEVLKTRMAPIIENSPQLSSLISKDVDSASVKMFTNGSILFALGASANSSHSLINRPVTLALTDELDKCDYAMHTGLRSRQTHSVHKPRIAISTPTVPGVGINAEAKGRQLHYQIVICHKCGHEYKPDYYEQVKIPGYDDPLSTLTVEKVRDFDLQVDYAYHHCPKCHKVSDLTPKFRRWVVEDAHLRKIHVRLTPFDAPSFISPSDLVTSQLTYSSIAEFDNQSLGLPCKLSEASIDRSSIVFTKEDAPTGIPIAGLDLGKTSYFMKGILNRGIIFVDFFDMIPVGELEHRVTSNLATGKVASAVSDSLPFLDTVHKLTLAHPMFWGAIYNVPKQPEPQLFKLKLKEEDNVRQVSIQKNLFMDHVAGMIATGQIVFKHSQFNDAIVQHFLDMRRIRDHQFKDVRYQWVKSREGIDHWWHALCYLVCASKIIMKSSTGSGLQLGTIIKGVRVTADV